MTIPDTTHRATLARTLTIAFAEGRRTPADVADAIIAAGWAPTTDGDLLARAIRDRDEAMDHRDEVVEDAYETALERGAPWALQIHEQRAAAPTPPTTGQPALEPTIRPPSPAHAAAAEKVRARTDASACRCYLPNDVDRHVDHLTIERDTLRADLAAARTQLAAVEAETQREVDAPLNRSYSQRVDWADGYTAACEAIRAALAAVPDSKEATP